MQTAFVQAYFSPNVRLYVFLLVLSACVHKGSVSWNENENIIKYARKCFACVVPERLTYENESLSSREHKIDLWKQHFCVFFAVHCKVFTNLLMFFMYYVHVFLVIHQSLSTTEEVKHHLTSNHWCLHYCLAKSDQHPATEIRSAVQHNELLRIFPGCHWIQGEYSCFSSSHIHSHLKSHSCFLILSMLLKHNIW